MKETILVVDDAPANLNVINSLLCPTYLTRIATSGENALGLVHAGPPPDLILLDVMMPEMDGYEVCRRLKADPVTAGIPVIFLTARTQVEDEINGFTVGAVDYIGKPISPPVLLARVRTHLSLLQAQRSLREQNRVLETAVQRRTREIGMIQDATMVALGSLAETRDNETGNHLRRTQRYVRLLAQNLPEYAEVLTPATVEALYRSAPLHDIGKVGVPDRILLKPGKLTPEELEVMKTHARLGRDAIMEAEKHLDGPSDFLALARDIAYCHHEKWDGSGYPQGLAGESIPLAARLMAVADVYDALISQRVYKPAFSHDKAVGIIRDGRGSHFDPAIVDAFLRLADQFQALARDYADSEAEVFNKARLEDLVSSS